MGIILQKVLFSDIYLICSLLPGRCNQTFGYVVTHTKYTGLFVKKLLVNGLCELVSYVGVSLIHLVCFILELLNIRRRSDLE